MNVASRIAFRKSARQDRRLLHEAASDKNHAFHSTAVHMKQEAALRNNPMLLRHVLNDPTHALHRKAQIINARKTTTVRRPAYSSLPYGSSRYYSSAPTKLRRPVQ
jgi:homoserine kinase